MPGRYKYLPSSGPECISTRHLPSEATACLFPLLYSQTMSYQIYPVEEESQERSIKMPEHAPIAEDAVFGEITEEGPNYRDVGILHHNPARG